MQFHFYSPVHFEKWDYRSSIIRGIGGSETSHVEMAWRLARRGHQINSYAPIPRDCKQKWRRTIWKTLDSADFTQPGIWVIYREASCLDQMKKTKEQQVWLMCQDEIARGLNQERVEKIDKVLALCQWHKEHMERALPMLKGKIVVTSNGVKTELIRELEAKAPERNPHRLMYASSPDRGLMTLLKIFPKVREFVADAELHCFYGFDNLKKLAKFNAQFFGNTSIIADLKAEMKQPGVFWHGRVSQKELYREWMKSAIWCYPTDFTETSCITCMEAQSLGAIPVTRPLAALSENVLNGVMLQGNPGSDALVRDRYVGELVSLLWRGVVQQDLRKTMMPMARAQHCWERVVDQWESWIFGWDTRHAIAQFAFQVKHGTPLIEFEAKDPRTGKQVKQQRPPRVLNVGCADDPAGLGRFGTNLDVMEQIPWTGQYTKAHIYHDARNPFPKNLGKYDRVILGDILEHMKDADAVRVLRNCVRALRPNGEVIITCPEDYRKVDDQHAAKGLKYLPGESAYHERPITLAIIDGWLRRAGLKRITHQVIDYAHFAGCGVVAVRSSHELRKDRSSKTPRRDRSRRRARRPK